MAAKDFYHNQVIEALTKDGWEITHDPYVLPLETTKVLIDLGAERDVIGATNGKEKIAVEVKSFLGKSDVIQFRDAFGQYLIYLNILSKQEPDRELFLAVPEQFYNRLLTEPSFMEVIKKYSILMLIYNPTTKNIESWIK
ncbi:MAG: element excision factor XisH family protein [Bacteroidota bacterium]